MTIEPHHSHAWRRSVEVVRIADGKRARAFEALVPLRCHNCDQTIPPGERFSRVRLTTRGDVRVPFCRTCLPFIEPVV